VVAGGAGALRPGRLRTLTLRPRAPLACGGVVAQLTVRAAGGQVATATRKAPVRRCAVGLAVLPAR
jgi:hypothetical protein